MRILRGIQATCALASAGGPEDLTGYDDAASAKLHEAACDALVWVNEEIEKREKKSKRRKK